MEARERTLRTYESADGRVPFNEWLAGLRDRKARAIIRTRLDRVSLGLLGDYKSVGGGVQELRISYGSGYRVYFAQVGDIIIILLCGGDKSSQQQDIERAKNYWDDYRSREDA
ncbi:type II toxin-antitoxin system RelE/ParE family toxin [Acaryochloris sp. IP29b_bin.148]|uniref:type II toxin-antitoxin system RelE/ParE family toxin n=1 Tax=Acaryochloris sp. IP29b_bin.148 TaxID=2969218 RepID=UPI00262DEFB3|nr:type II toxin-antitoxin system RelE/ParE family toxin [Acaryochloris sp. IP29b_bin.148]